MKKILLLTLALCATVYSFAQETINVEQIKAKADSAYMNNDFVTAIQAYELILEQGEASEIYYNLGNSYYKSDNVAKAILNYERALLLNPGNEDIRTNLEIARGKTVDKVEAAPEIFYVNWFESLINMANVDTWAVWGIVFFILFILAMYFFIFSKRLLFKKSGFIGGIVFLLLVVCSNIFASYQKKVLLNREYAIITAPSVTVRSTPDESGLGLFILHEGRKVKIKDNSMKAWKEIIIEDGKVGWILTSDIEVI